MQVLFFGKLGERAGPSRSIDTSDLATVADVTARLCEDPALAEMFSDTPVVTVLDDQIVRGEAPITGARELAYLPPLSGG